MQSEFIQHALQHPESLDESHVEELQEIVAAYPWFSAGQVLLAKALHKAGSLKYDDQLHLAAVHAGSRAVIYDLIVSHEVEHERDVIQAPPIVEAVSQKVEEVEQTETSPASSDAIEPESAITAEQEVTSLLAETDTIQEAETASPPVEIIPDPITNSPEVEEAPVVRDEPRETDQDLGELEKTIIIGAVSRVIEQEVSEEVGLELSDAPPRPTAQVTEETEPLSGFAAWVLKRSRETGYTSEESAEPGLPLTPNEPISEESDRTSAHSKKQSHLIDAFISKDPKITPGRVSDYSTEDLAKESLRENEALVTETMAKVYARQGKLAKARKAYELLALKYPEKSVYFANQLKKLDRKK